jgi:hypothetical protein
MECNRFFAHKFGKNKVRRTTLASKLALSGISYGEELQPVGSGGAQVADPDLTAAVSDYVIQQRISQLESTVTALNQKLSSLEANAGSRVAVSAGLSVRPSLKPDWQRAHEQTSAADQEILELDVAAGSSSLGSHQVTPSS